jgi:phospholipid/cholesterol/gamma-HCH transport system substrate-binding protein
MKRTNHSNLALVLAIAVFSVFVLVGVMFFGHIWTTGSNYHVSVYVANARGVADDATVFEAGLPVGQVTGIKRSGPDAILTLRLSGGVRPLPSDTTVQMGLRSLAGEADVLLTPGKSGQTVRNNGSLGLSNNQDFTEVDQILNALQGKTAPATRKFFQAAGYGLNGEGTNLNQVLGNATSLVNNSPLLTSTLAHQDKQVGEIVENFGNVMNSIGQRTTALREFAVGATTTFKAVAARDVKLSQLLVHLPYFLRGAREVTHSVGQNLPAVNAVLLRLASSVTRLSPALRELDPAAVRGITLVRSLGSASPALKNILVELKQLKPSATAALPALHAVTCQLDPMVRYLEPYGPDASAFFESFGGATDAYGLDSHQLLLVANVNPDEFIRGLQGPSGVAGLQTLINVGIFQKLGAGTGYDPDPAPNSINHEAPQGLGISGASQWAAAHPNSFPHVTQDCPVPAGDAPKVPAPAGS